MDYKEHKEFVEKMMLELPKINYVKACDWKRKAPVLYVADEHRVVYRYDLGREYKLSYSSINDLMGNVIFQEAMLVHGDTLINTHTYRIADKRDLLFALRDAEVTARAMEKYKELENTNENTKSC